MDGQFRDNKCSLCPFALKSGYITEAETTRTTTLQAANKRVRVYVTHMYESIKWHLETEPEGNPAMPQSILKLNISLGDPC